MTLNITTGKYNRLTTTTHLMQAVCELTPWRSPVGGADGGWRGAYGWSNKPPPLARKMPSRWAFLASKEGSFTKKSALFCPSTRFELCVKERPISSIMVGMPALCTPRWGQSLSTTVLTLNPTSSTYISCMSVPYVKIVGLRLGWVSVARVYLFSRYISFRGVSEILLYVCLNSTIHSSLIGNENDVTKKPSMISRCIRSCTYFL